MKFWRRKEVVAPPASARAERDIWLEWLRLSGLSERTVYGYQRSTDRFLERWGELAFAEITDEMIQGFIEEAKPASRQQRRSPFANWFAWGYRTKRIPHNPMHHVPAYKVPVRPTINVFTEEECRQLCALPEPDGTLLALLLGTGLRKQEATMLTVKRIDLKHGELRVIEGAKGGHHRIVPLSTALLGRLERHILRNDLEETDYLWPIRPGGGSRVIFDRPITGSSFHKWFGDCLFHARVPYRKPHTTRHTYATAWRRQGLTMDDVAVLLGHADLKTTKQVYDHTNVWDVRRRMEALDGAA